MPQHDFYLDLLDALLEEKSHHEIEIKIVNQAIKLFKGDWGGVRYYYGNNFEEGYGTFNKELLLIPRHGGYAQRAVANQEPCIIDSETIHRINPEASKTIQTVLFAPLYHGDETIGLVMVASAHDQKASDATLRLLRRFGAFSGRVLKISRRQEAINEALKKGAGFRSFASHELKNPLTIIRNFAHQAQDQLSNGGLVENVVIKKIIRASRDMEHLIADLLDGGGHNDDLRNYQIVEISLKELYKEICSDFSSLHPQRRLIKSYKLKKDASIWADRSKLKQVLTNLLNNAVKYSDDDQPVELYFIEDGDCYLIKVKDYGIGIPKEEHDEIFSEFYRASNSISKEGMGVGLYLANRIVEKLEGKLEFDSQLGKGSEFRVYLPRLE